MDDVLIGQVHQPLHDIGYKGVGSALLHVPVLAYFGLEVTIVAQLSDDVAVAGTREHLETFEHVGVVETLQDVDLSVKQLLEFLALEGLEFDYLNGHDFVWVDGRVLVISWCARYTLEKLPWPSSSENLKM